MKKILKIGIIALLLLEISTWLAGAVLAPEKNPAARHEGNLVSETADPLLKKACFDCHSHETRWPWYNSVPPVSMLVGLHVAEGRKEVNFSLWNNFDDRKKVKILAESLEEISEHKMPMPSYLLLHQDARLSESEIKTLEQEIFSHYPAVATELEKDENHEEH